MSESPRSPNGLASAHGGSSSVSPVESPGLPQSGCSSASAQQGGSAQPPTPEEMVREEQIFRQGHWVIQFGELIFGIVLGLSMEKFAEMGIFTDTGLTLDMFGRIGPLILLYFWVFFYVVLYWFNMRREAPIMAIFHRRDIGILEIVLVSLLGFVFYQTFDAIMPEGAATADARIVRDAVDAAMWSLGGLIVFDAIAQLSAIRRMWLESCNFHQANLTPHWQLSIPALRRYYGKLFPIKTIGLTVVYFVVFIPLVPWFGWRYPLLNVLGLQDNVWVIVVGFLIINIGFELFLSLHRSALHNAAMEYLVALKRRSMSVIREDVFKREGDYDE